MPTFTLNVPIVTDTPTITVEGLQPGQHQFQLVVEDDAGNRSVPATAVITVGTPIPGITALVPSFGKWGDSVTIQGMHFDPDPLKNNVAFNTVNAPVLSSTGTEIAVSVPRPATTGPVTVQTSFGTGVSPTPFVIPVSFTVGVGLQPSDLAYDAVRGEVWVVNSGSVEGNRGAVSIVSLAQRKLLSTILVGVSPREIALSPPGAAQRRALVTNSGDSTTSVINMETQQVLATLKVGANPLGVDISPDGRWGYVVSAGAIGEPVGTVSVIDLAEIRVLAAIKVGQAPTRVVFGRDGREAFVINTGDGTVSVVDVGAHRVSNVVRVGPNSASSPQEVAVSLETYPVWVANMGSRSASLIARDHSMVDVEIGIAPGGVAVSPKGDRAVFAGPHDKAMVVVVLREGQPFTKLLQMSGLGGNVKAVAITPDGRGVIVVHPDLNAVSVFDISTMRLQAPVNVPTLPIRGLVTSDNKFACIICQKGNALAVIEMGSVLP